MARAAAPVHWRLPSGSAEVPQVGYVASMKQCDLTFCNVGTYVVHLGFRGEVSGVDAGMSRSGICLYLFNLHIHGRQAPIAR